MATPTYATVISQINTFIIANGNNEITANVLNPILKVITDFANNTIGNLETLNTTDKTTIVNAINTLKIAFDNLNNKGVQLLTGFVNPNVTPPINYNYADFYIQLDIFDNSPIQLWQWNGIEWTTYASVYSKAEMDFILNNYYTKAENNQSLIGKEDKINKNVINGYAGLDATGKVATAQLPSYVDDILEFTNLATFPLTGEAGKIYVALDTNKTYRWSGTTYIYITSGAVDSVAGKTGVVTLVKADVGLNNVDNTTDANKPVSTAQQSALDLKAPIRPVATKVTLVDADETTGNDSASSFVQIKTTWANVKAFLKTYFDGLYPSGSGTSTGTNTGDVTLVAGSNTLITTAGGVSTISSTVSGGGANGRIYYPQNSVASSLSGYKVASTIPSPNSTSNVSIICPTQNAYVLGEEFATLAGEPNTTSLPSGTAIRFFFASVTGGTAQIQVNLFQYKTTGNIATTGAVSFTYGTGGTITRGAGSFITDGFTAGCKITVAGTVSNNGTFTVQSVSALVLTLVLSDVLVNETVISTITTKEKLLRTGESPTFTNMTSQLIQFFYTDSASHVLASDDRIVFKWFGRRTSAGASQTITIGTEGLTTASYIQTTLPVNLGLAQGTSLMLSGLNPSEILGTDASKNIVSLPVATYPSLAELALVKGVTSPIQTQLNATVTGSGTQNYLPKFGVGGKVVGNSKIFDNGIKLGINTDNPYSPFQVGNYVGANGYAYGNVATFAGEWGETTPTLALLSIDNTLTQNKGGVIGFGGGSEAGSTPYIYAQIKGLKEAAGAVYSGYLSFCTTAANSDTQIERARITSGGNVGISYSTGTQIDNNKLAVNGNTFVNGSVQVGDNVAVASASNVGAIRYRSDSNNSYADMCMLTGVGVYSWVNIITNTF